MDCKFHCGEQTRDFDCRLFDISMPRTGTRSVAEAVRRIGLIARHGFKRCPTCHDDAVEKLLRGRTDFDVYRTCEYSSGIPDLHWRRLVEDLPTAKFILCVRPSQKWARSWSLRNSTAERHLRQLREGPIKWYHLLRIFHFGMIAWDRTVWTRRYEAHNEEVMGVIPAERLHVVNVFESEDNQELWDGLADFIGRPRAVDPGSFPYFERGNHVVYDC